MKYRLRVWHRVVTRNVIIAGAVLALGGGGLLWWALAMPSDWGVGKEIAKELGTTIFGLGVIALTWELFARRSFMREVLDSVDLADQIAEAGLQQFCWHYNQEIPWKELFEKSTEIDLFFAYAQTWRNNNFAHIEQFAAKAGVKLRVVLPNFRDDAVVAELAKRFAYPPEKLRGLIQDAVAFYSELPNKFPGGVTVEVRLVGTCPLIAIYLFSEAAVFTLHSHQQKRVSVPTVLVSAKKPVYAFLRDEFECLYRQSQPAANGQIAPPTTEVATNDQAYTPPVVVDGRPAG